MRIALVCDELPPRPHGGIGTFVAALAGGLARRGHAVEVVEFGETAGSRVQDGYAVTTLPAARWHRARQVADRIRLRRYLDRRIAEGAIDIVEVPDFLGFLPFGLAHAGHTVVRLHNTLTAIHRFAGLPRPPLLSFCERRTLAANPAWLPLSAYITTLTDELFPGVAPRMCAVVPPGLAVPGPGAPVEAPARFILHAGTVSEVKGVVVLAAAARAALAADPELRLVFAGRIVATGGRDPRDAVAAVLGPELFARCVFTGHVSREEIIGYMRRATVFASASLLECFPLTVVEAMAAGCACVVPDRAPFDEVVAEGTGVLAAGADGFSDAFLGLLADRARRAALGEAAARHVAAELSPDRFLDRTLAFYQARLDAAAPAGRATRVFDALGRA